jgi:aquaporin Z
MNKYLVEFLGTLFLSFIVFSTNNYLAIGSALAIAVLLGGSVSGGAFNPAIAVGLFYAKKINQQDLFTYVVCEILGGLVGFFIVKKLINR